jgi:prepilin-type N-terminal cleavage/methylation domain-containing protein
MFNNYRINPERERESLTDKSVDKSVAGESGQNGFTLIELLVVISIISLLSSVVLASLSTAQASARDSQRIQSLQQIQTALELYYNNNRQYPTGCRGTGMWSGEYSSAGGCSDDYISGLAPQHIQALPNDPAPQETWSGYLYYVSSDRQDYKIMAYQSLEEMRLDSEDKFARYPQSCGWENQHNTAAIATDGERCR